MKIAFISHVPESDALAYSECLRYIRALEVPDGCEVETIAIHEAPSMAAAYNQGMRQTDAAYKIYLRPRTLLIEKQLLRRLLDPFEASPRLGMLGLIGARLLAPNGNWRESPFRYGQAYHQGGDGMEHLSLLEPSEGYQTVQALDEAVLITRVDVAWREDLFPHPPFLGQSQCMEFIRAGYEVGIPRQEKPWLLYDGDLQEHGNGLTGGHSRFLREYRPEIRQTQPLVSVLIPATARPRRLELAIRSVLHQTYSNLEVLVLDDGQAGDLEQRLAPFGNASVQIRRIDLTGSEGPDNGQRAFDACRSDYVSWLLEDDLFHPEKIEQMLPYLMLHPALTLVFSPQLSIDESGNALEADTEPLFDSITYMNGASLAEHMLSLNGNRVGNASAALFRRSALTEPWGTFGGTTFAALADTASWFGLLAGGQAAFLPQPLSYVRQPGRDAWTPVDTLAEWQALMQNACDRQLWTRRQHQQALALQFARMADLLADSLARGDDSALQTAQALRPLIQTGATSLIP